MPEGQERWSRFLKDLDDSLELCMWPLGEQICIERKISGCEASFKPGEFIQKGHYTGKEAIWCSSQAMQREKTESRLVNPKVHLLHKQLLEENITVG